MGLGATLRRDFWVVGNLARYLWLPGMVWLKVGLVLAIVMLVGAKVATVVSPLFFRQLIDSLDRPQGTAIILPLGIILGWGLAKFFEKAFVELRDALFAAGGERAVRTIALEVFRHLHVLSLRFHLDRQTGGLSRTIERGIRAVELLLRLILFSILPTFIEFSLVAGILFSFFPPIYGSVTLATMLIYIVFTFLVTEWRLKFRRAMNRMDSSANTKAIDSLLNYETVKYFGNEEHEATRFDLARRAYEKAAVRSKLSLSLLNVGQAVIIGGGATILMIMAGFDLTNGAMNLGDVVLINLYIVQLAIPLNALGFVYREIKQSLTDLEGMFALGGEVPEISDAADAPALASGPGEVRFDHVEFGYGPDRTVLLDVSFDVPAGQTIAIVGPSGAGKSTISRLLFRFYDVNGGTIRIDGQDIRSVRQASLRRAIGIVPQDTVLFNDTIFYNIAYGRPDASRDGVEGAARMAHIHEFIQSLPEGYDTVVGERGLKLSGGERQRVAIARTILKQPRILLFDEATSALDTHTEKEIQEALKTISANRTTLVIAHRLSTIIDADRIIVLQGGRIAEQGRHHDLLTKTNGLYAAMWSQQQLAMARGEEEARPLSVRESNERQALFLQAEAVAADVEAGTEVDET